MAFLIPIISSLYEHVKNIGISSLSSETQDNSSGETEGSLPTRERLDRELGVIPLAIVLAPTRELASQIHREAQKLCYGSPVRASCLYGGLDIRQQLFELSHGSDIIIATPGRLSDVVDRGIISLSQVKIFTMDEADRMLDMGFEVKAFVIFEAMPGEITFLICLFFGVTATDTSHHQRQRFAL